MHTVSQIAERFQVSRETVLSWIDAGELVAINVAPSGSKHRFLRVSDASLEDFERSRGTHVPPKPASPSFRTKVRQFV